MRGLIESKFYTNVKKINAKKAYKSLFKSLK